MVKILGEEKIRELARVPRNFDLGLIDFEYGFSQKIFPIISGKVLEKLKEQEPKIYELIIKSGIFYSFVLDIPKIKVHLANYGIAQHEAQKAKNAPWWDVRDLGLSWLKKADNLLLEAMELLSETGLKNEISFFKQSFSLVDFHTMNDFYPIQSAEVYLKLCRMMRDAFDELMLNFGLCTAELLLNDPKLSVLIKKYLLHHSVLVAMNTAGLSFISRGIVVQYEELPWQKSTVLSADTLLELQQFHQKCADGWLTQIWDYMHEHKAEFPCYSPPEDVPTSKILRKNGGLFL